jgi:hypothetical protein
LAGFPARAISALVFNVVVTQKVATQCVDPGTGTGWI